MKNEDGYDEGARWLQSDSQIIGRVQRTAHKQGILLTLPLPHGGECVAVVEKLNAASMSQFCEMARGEYIAWKGEQVARQERASREAERRREQPEEVEETHEESVAVNPLDPESIRKKIFELEKQLDQWFKILEVLDAPKDDEDTGTGVPKPEEVRQGEGKSVDYGTCEQQLQRAGESTVREADKDSLNLAPPPTDTVDSKED